DRPQVLRRNRCPLRRLTGTFSFLSHYSGVRLRPSHLRRPPMNRHSVVLVSAILMHIVVQAAPQRTSAPEALPATIEFNRDIRPILADKCFQCHGPAAQQATLRFDLEDGAKHALSGGRFAIVPGDPANSQIIKRVSATDPAIRMPKSQG